MRQIRFFAVPLSGALALAVGAMLFFTGIRIGLTPAPKPSVVASSEELPPPEARVGETAPDFELLSLDGTSVSLSSLRGHPVLVYFWASWCTYCTEEMPRLVIVQEKYHERGLHLLAINIMESPGTIREFFIEAGLSLPVLLDPEARIAQQYNVRATPTYFFIDRDGTLVSRIIGQARSATLAAQVQRILLPVPD